MPIELTSTASETDAAIQKKTYGSGFTTFIISNAEMEDIMKILKSTEYSGLLIKVDSEEIKNEAKEQKGGFLGMLLGTLGASLLESWLIVKGTIRAGEGIIRVGENF